MFDATAALIRHRQAGDQHIASDPRAQKRRGAHFVLQAKHRARKSRASLQSDLYQYLYQFMSGRFSRCARWMAPHSRRADLAGRKKAGIYSQSIRSERASLSLALEELSDSLSLIQRKEE